MNSAALTFLQVNLRVKTVFTEAFANVLREIFMFIFLGHHHHHLKFHLEEEK